MEDQCEKYGVPIRQRLDQIFDDSPLVSLRDGFAERRMCKQHSLSINIFLAFLMTTRWYELQASQSVRIHLGPSRTRSQQKRVSKTLF